MRSLLALLLALLPALCACHSPSGSSAHDPMLVHSVYFTLKQDSPAARARLIDSCYELLAPIPGIVHFAAGARDAELTREVNDQDFHVALTVVFRDRAAHDRYQPDPRHQRFIADNKDGWARVRVFDSDAR